MPYPTLSDLENHVRDCHLDYAVAGIEVGDPLYEWDNSHHPDPACLGGTKTVLLMRKDHAIHGVIQSEVYQYPCVSTTGWERPYLPEEYLDLYQKWKRELSRLGGLTNTPKQQKARKRVGERAMEEGLGIHDPEYRESKEQKEARERGGKKTVEEGLGIHDPEYRESEDYKEMREKVGKKVVEEGLGFHDPKYRESWEYKEAVSRGGKTTNSQKWMCTETGFIANPGSLTNYQKARGIDPSRRVRLTEEETAFIFLWSS